MMRMGAFFTGMASRNPYKGRAADPLAKLEQRAGDDTRKMLAAIQRNIVRLRGVVAGAKDPQQLRVRDKLYHEVYAAYAELGAKINGVLKGGVANAAMLSAEAVISSLSAHGRDLFRFSMERAKRYWRYICPENGRSLAATMTDKMSEDLVETLRRATVEVERQAAVEGWTRDEIRKAIEDKWAEISKDDRNFKFVDRSGRAWENGRYCQMLARTTATRVYNDSFLDRLAEEGFNLVKVSSHGSEPDCDICRAWGGKICVISGKGGKYPTVEDARAAGVFHPNCMCTWEYVDEDEDRAELEKQALKAGEKVDWNDPEAVEKHKSGGEEEKRKSDGEKAPTPITVDSLLALAKGSANDPQAKDFNLRQDELPIAKDFIELLNARVGALGLKHFTRLEFCRGVDWNASVRFGTFKVNIDSLKNAEKLWDKNQREAQDRKDGKAWLVASSRDKFVQVLVDHELGHWAQQGNNRYKEIGAEFKKAKNNPAKLPSLYAKTNEMEFFAECYAQYHADKSRLTESQRKMVELVQDGLQEKYRQANERQAEGRKYGDKGRDEGTVQVVTTPEPFKLEKSLEPSPELAKFMADAGIARQTEPLDLSVTNPGFREDPGRHDNCTHCVVSAFLRLHGYDVQATPTKPGETFKADVYWENKSKRPLSAEARTADIYEAMQEFGSGAVAMVRIPTSATHSDGHVFLAMNQGGEITFYDGQTGNSENCHVTILNAPVEGRQAEKSWIMRLDDNRLTEEARECFKRSRK